MAIEAQSGIAETTREKIAPAEGRGSTRKSKFLIFGFLILTAAAVFLFLRSAKSHPKAAAQPIPTVAAAKVVRQDLYNEVSIPAEFRPYVQSELHAMVTGYVSQMNVDFGDKVKKGQVLATLEVPELLDELHHAQATEQQAQADYTNSHLIYARMETVNKQRPALVAQQDIDTAKSKDDSAAAASAAAKANVEKYQTLLSYTKIVAPFDGVITQRSADPGALVQAGTSSASSMALVQISDNYHLRLDFPVSVEYVKDVKVGAHVTVRVDSLGGKTFVGKIARFKEQVNAATRTMTTEMEVDNPDLEIVPGMYAVALFKFARRPNALAIPIEAVRDPKEPVVDVINASGEIEARPVKLGLETPDKYEVTDGLKEGELVLTSHGSRMQPGQKVKPKLVNQPTTP